MTADFDGVVQSIETRIDSASFNELVFLSLEEYGVEFTCSVPFERFPVLRKRVAPRPESRARAARVRRPGSG